MAMESFDPKDPEARNRLRTFAGPHHIDHMIRQAIQFCWMALPDDRQNVAEVEKEIRRIVDRALVNLREDADTFDVGRG